VSQHPFNRFSQPPSLTPLSAIREPIHCPRCDRQVERSSTAIGEGGYRQCADAAVCAATSVPKAFLAQGGEMRTLGAGGAHVRLGDQ